MGVGAFLRGPRFRLYSLGSLLAVIVFAGLTFLQVARLAANEPAPWLGLIERVGIYAWMLWVAVLAISLWSARGIRPEATDGGRSHSARAEPDLPRGRRTSF